MGRKTSGTLYTCGKNNFFYLRYRFEGKETRMRLLDLAGKPITSLKEARAAADRILAHIRESNRAEQLRTIQNDIRDAEQAAEQAAAQLVNSRATISGAWQLFMSCPKRPASCRRFPFDAIPEHTTVENYRRFLGKFQNFIEKNYPDARLLSDITPEIAADFMQSLQNLSSGTFNQCLNSIRAIFNTLIKAGKMLGKNPFAEIEAMPHHYNSKRPLSVEQIARLIDKAAGELRVLFALGYFTGLRLGDCCTLRWEEVDLIRGIIERIPRKTEHNIKDRGQATVKIGIPPFLFQLLASYPPEQRTGYLLPDTAADYLRNSGAVSHRISSHFKRCGIETKRPGTGIQKIVDPETGEIRRVGCHAVVEYGFHSLRYSYISHNAEAGTPAAIIQRNAGHSNPAMTEHYTKISDAAALKYAARLTLPNSGAPEVAPAPERDALHRLADTLPLDQVRKLLKIFQADS